MGVDLFYSKDGRWGQRCAYQSMSQLSGLAEVMVDSGRKATPHQATVGDD
jgi:hypothetical protein